MRACVLLLSPFAWVPLEQWPLGRSRRLLGGNTRWGKDWQYSVQYSCKQAALVPVLDISVLLDALWLDSFRGQSNEQGNRTFDVAKAGWTQQISTRSTFCEEVPQSSWLSGGIMT